MRPGIVLVVVHLKTESEGGKQRVLEVRVTVESLRAVAEVVIDFSQEIAFAERLTETAAQICKRRAGQTDRRKPILLGALTVKKEEQLVLDDGSAHVSPELLALKRIVVPAGCVGFETVVANESERLAVKTVSPGLGGHVDRARRGQILGKVERRLAQLELVNRAGRDVGCCRTHGLVADINAVHVDAGGSAETT